MRCPRFLCTGTKRKARQLSQAVFLHRPGGAIGAFAPHCWSEKSPIPRLLQARNKAFFRPDGIFVRHNFLFADNPSRVVASDAACGSAGLTKRDRRGAGHSYAAAPSNGLRSGLRQAETGTPIYALPTILRLSLPDSPITFCRVAARAAMTIVTARLDRSQIRAGAGTRSSHIKH